MTQLTILSPQADTQLWCALIIYGLLILLKSAGAPKNKQEDMWRASKNNDTSDIDLTLDNITKDVSD